MEKSKTILCILFAFLLIGSVNFVSASDDYNSSFAIDDSSLSSSSEGNLDLSYGLSDLEDSVQNIKENNEKFLNYSDNFKYADDLNINNYPNVTLANADIDNGKLKQAGLKSNVLFSNDSKRPVNIQSQDIVKTYLNGTNLVAYLTDGIYGSNLRNRDLKVIIEDSTYSLKTNDFGIANMFIDLVPGNYDAVIYFDGDSKYDSFTKLIHITVYPMPTNLTAYNLIKYYLNGSGLLAYLDDADGNPLKDKEIMVSINNTVYFCKTNDDGEISLDINFIPGTYNATLSFSEDHYLDSKRNIKIAVLEKPTDILVSNITKDYGSPTNLTAYLKDINGNALADKTVKVNFEGTVYRLTTDEFGAISFNLDYLPGTYNVSLSFAENYYLSSYKEISVKILELDANAIHVSLDGDDNIGQGTLDSPYRTILKAISEAHDNSLIYIHNGTYWGEDNANLSINKNLTFASLFGDVILNASGKGRIFTVLPDISLSLRGLTFVSGDVNNFSLDSENSNLNRCGGAILSQGDLNISGCNFINNSANQGGAIYSLANLIVDSSYFISNQVNQSGGAIYNAKSNSVISNSYFIKNTALNKEKSVSGGAIDNVAENLTIINSVFDSNSVKETGKRSNEYAMGGAISNSAKNLTIDGCDFINNSAEIRANGMGTCLNTSWGGAIYSSDCGLNVYNSYFENDSAHVKTSVNAVGIYGNSCIGGAIYVKGSGEGLNIVNNTFYNCSSAYGAVRFVARNAQFINNTFDNNKALFMGSAIYDSGENTTYKGNTFVNHNETTNPAQGTVYVYSHNVTFEDNVFENNYNTKEENDNSPAIYIYNPGYYSEEKTDIKIINNTFDKNKEGIYFYGACGAVIENNSFTNSKYQAISTYVGHNVDIVGNYFENNHGYFGNIWFNSYDSNIINNVFISNSGVEGGALALLVRTGLNISDNVFINNSAKGGGAIYSLYSSMVLDNNYFKDNYAENGTALYLDRSSGNASGNVFNNTGDSYGLIFQSHDLMHYDNNDIYLNTRAQSLSEYVSNHARTPNDFNLIEPDFDSEIDLNYNYNDKPNNYRNVNYNDGSAYYSDDLFDEILNEFNEFINELKTHLVDVALDSEGSGNATNSTDPSGDGTNSTEDITNPSENQTDVNSTNSSTNSSDIPDPLNNSTDSDGSVVNGTGVDSLNNSTDSDGSVVNGTVVEDESDISNTTDVNSTNTNSTNANSTNANSTNTNSTNANSTNANSTNANSTDSDGSVVNGTVVPIPIDDVIQVDNNTDANETVNSTNITEIIDEVINNLTNNTEKNITESTDDSKSSGYVNDEEAHNNVGISDPAQPSSHDSQDISSEIVIEESDDSQSEDSNYESDFWESNYESSSSVGVSNNVPAKPNAYELTNESQEPQSNGVAFKNMEFVPVLVVLFALLLVFGYMIDREDRI